MRLKKAERINIMIGTAGHIDHGKTELTRLLTGCDTDRLPAEKERGMSLELGFAPWYTPDGRVVGIVDVPGHERFVRKMVAAATSIDVLLLVVAADDGVMPQTREHLDICTILGLERGMIALTKIDLVDDTGRELALDDVRAAVRGTFLESAPTVAVSPITGEGFEDFYTALADLVDATPLRQTSGVFRMPVERRFVQKGSGTVVTGIPQAGSVSVNDTLELLPRQQSGRVRGLQVYRMEDETARAGECVALNIPDLDHNLVERGQVLAAPGYFESTRHVAARLRLLPSAKPLRNRATVRFHAGMREVVGRVVLLERDQLAPGDDCLVQLLLEQPVVAWSGDPLVIRLHSPVVTVGGGTVLDCSTRRLRRYQEDSLDGLRERERALSDGRLAEYELIHADPVPLRRDALARLVKLSPDELTACLEPLVAAGEVVEVGHRADLFHAQHVMPVRERILRTLADFHERHPMRLGMRLGMPVADLLRELAAPEGLPEHLLAVLQDEGKLVCEGGLCRLPGHAVDVRPEQEPLFESLERLYIDARFLTPDAEAAAKEVGADEGEVAGAIGLLCDRGTLVEVEPGIVFHTQAVEEAKKLAVAQIRKEGPMPTPVFRDLLGVSRRHAVPLLDYLDRMGATFRVGNTRVLRPPRG